MNTLRPLFITSLLLMSFQSFANRPAQDDDAASQTSIQSNAPAPNIDQNSNSNPASETDSNLQTGDVIQLESKAHTPFIDFPKRGMHMSKVINELGEPTRRFPAIGKPPITRWLYPDRTVFFEYSHVIHVVAQ